jgi:hypothetical protein
LNKDKKEEIRKKYRLFFNFGKRQVIFRRDKFGVIECDKFFGKSINCKRSLTGPGSQNNNQV